MLDGADNNDTSVPGGQGGISAANPDSTQEFRVITNNFDAEFGRNTGAIIDVVTRGGGNKFHGSAYEFGRYNALGARDYFNKKENGPQDPYVRNDFRRLGWRPHLEGPHLLLPQRRSPALSHHAYLSRRPRLPPSGPASLPISIQPTAARRLSISPDPHTNPDNYAGLQQDPLVAKILALAPVGQADNGDGVSTTYFFPSPDALNSYNLTGRLDHKLTDRHQLAVRYIYGHSARTAIPCTMRCCPATAVPPS